MPSVGPVVCPVEDRLSPTDRTQATTHHAIRDSAPSEGVLYHSRIAPPRSPRGYQVLFHGHPLGAGRRLEALACVKSMRGPLVPPTIAG